MMISGETFMVIFVPPITMQTNVTFRPLFHSSVEPPLEVMLFLVKFHSTGNMVGTLHSLNWRKSTPICLLHLREGSTAPLIRG